MFKMETRTRGMSREFAIEGSDLVLACRPTGPVLALSFEIY